MGLNDVRLGLKRWLQKEIGATVIFAEQGAPRPSSFPYGSLRIQSINQVGGDDALRDVDAQGKQKTYGVRSAVFGVAVYGPGATALLEKALGSLHKPTVREELYYTYGISAIDDEGIINLTELLETDWEERAQMDLMVMYAIEQEDDVGLIEKVEINDVIYDITTP
ncbi:MAG: hypothetical protein GWN93_26735 [Deltaproteobacteria bacterium]|nr:hypothetical protein [Deltaproteobacteria bacterium]